TGEEAGVDGEEAEVQRADEATDEVDAHHVERVVEAELELELHREGADRTGDDTEQQGPTRGEVRAGRGDRDETGDGTRGGADRGRLALLELLDHEPTDDRSGGGTEGVDRDETDARHVVGELGTGV